MKNSKPKSITPLIALVATPLAAVPVQAQSIPFVPDIYMGLEAGTGERSASRFGQPGTVVSSDESNGVDYGAFVGVELPAFPLGYMAVEAGIGDSTGETTAIVRDGATDRRVSTQARFNWSATARLGLAPLPGFAAYGIAGYGGEQIDLTVTDVTTGASFESDDSMDGIIYGLGARYMVGTDVGIRAEYRHREASGAYDPEQFMLGAFVSF
ncbi:outer membrane protein [Parasphingopyxis lamellibrachiae]|uniref:Outer membrane autotransporter protein n=1 Tax=Parasphingopyxis lamellibrachiae TaxID=680125 RepID=A0A3D9FDD9_9SPHN|nr:outer membrane beta-barrel protein [Parasphingopyxis lamellibrachiae]RED15071.1 outer membrane autotransporter protein [Parasphingopyxis lamellibrachiae]